MGLVHIDHGGYSEHGTYMWGSMFKTLSHLLLTELAHSSTLVYKLYLLHADLAGVLTSLLENEPRLCHFGLQNVFIPVQQQNSMSVMRGSSMMQL